MNNKKILKILAGMFFLAVFILIISVLLKLTISLYISGIFILDHDIELIFALIFLILDAMRVLVVILIFPLIIILNNFKKKYKLGLLTALFLDLILNLLFLVRFFIYFCFTPLFAFISLPLVLLSFVAFIILLRSYNQHKMKF